MRLQTCGVTTRARQARKSEQVIGVLGGMGAGATIDLFATVVRGTRGKTDREHLRILIDDNPKIPDRITSTSGISENPVPELRRCALALEEAGADLVVTPCVGAYFFYDALQECVNPPILHIVNETL